MGLYVFSLPNSLIKSEVWTIIHCLGLGHETMVCAVCLFIFLWSCDMAGLLRGTFVSWWYLPRIRPPVTEMQHHYHTRYPTDDWHLTCMFSLVYFSVELCLVGVFPHSVSIWSDRCVRACVPLMNCTPTPTPLTRKQYRTDARVCLHYWVVIWVAGYCNPPLSHSFWGCHGHDTYDLKVVFCFRHFTASHYHHYARVLTGIENLQTSVEFILWRCV